MKKGWLVNLGLFLFLFLAAWLLEQYDRQEDSKREAEEATRSITSLVVHEISRADFTDGDGQTVTLTRAEEQWQITAPRAMRTDQHAAGRLFSLLGRHYSRKAQDKPEDLAAFGLDKPAARLVLHAPNDAVHTFLVGDATPASGERYLRLGETGPVVMVAALDVSGLLKKVDDLRATRLTDLGELDTLTRIELKRATDTLLLEREKDAPWRMTAPVADGVDEERLATWFRNLAGLRAKGFVNILPPADPQWTLRLHGATSEDIPLWTHDGAIHAQRPGESDAIRLPEYAENDLNKAALELVPLKALPPDRKITAFTLVHGGETFRAKPDAEGNWPSAGWSVLVTTTTTGTWKAEIPSAPLPADASALTVETDQGSHAFALYQRDALFILAPADRPVHLVMTELQSEALGEGLKALQRKAAAPEATPDASAESTPEPAAGTAPESVPETASEPAPSPAPTP